MTAGFLKGSFPTYTAALRCAERPDGSLIPTVPPSVAKRGLVRGISMSSYLFVQPFSAGIPQLSEHGPNHKAQNIGQINAIDAHLQLIRQQP